MTLMLMLVTGAVTLVKKNLASCVLVNLLCAHLLFVGTAQVMHLKNVTMATQSLVTDAQTYALLNKVGLVKVTCLLFAPPTVKMALW